MSTAPNLAPITALTPRGEGHQFVLYGDSCSGVPAHAHAANLRTINAVVMRLAPSPEFIIFPGDEVIGLTADEQNLRDQWRFWWDVEMVEPRSLSVPIYNCTANHTVYDPMSERVFRDACSHLPANGPVGQERLCYFDRRGDLLLVVVNTLWSGLGGEGHMETEWLETVLRDHADARWKLVVGHHPVFPVNGYVGDYQRTIGAEYRDRFWRLLVDHQVMAYLCSHILAFDVQVHQGVLQITSAGAGTAHRMPEGLEYLHCVQAALDTDGLRYQVLDTTGAIRERLQWPFSFPASKDWADFAPVSKGYNTPVRVWRISGQFPADPVARRQTLLSLAPCGHQNSIWIGLQGMDQLLTVSLAPQAGRSPHSWYGPRLGGQSHFDIQLALHADMGPGGLLWRADDAMPWSTMTGASAWGPERLDWKGIWTIGHAGPSGAEPFAGQDLRVRYCEETRTSGREGETNA